MKRQTLGEAISPILNEIENALMDGEILHGQKPCFTQDGFRAAIKIFSAVIMDKMFELQSNEKLPLEDKLNMAQKCGEDIRKIVKIYTDIDTFDLYK